MTNVNTTEFLRVVDHAEIFADFEHCLPTFNSLSISTVLWRIAGLADQFLYLNDDFCLLQPLRPEDFFDDGIMLVRGEWRLQSSRRPLRWAAEALRRMLHRDPSQARVRHLTVLERGAQVAGETQRYLRLWHTPYPMRRSTLAAFFGQHPDLLAANLSHRLRSNGQFNPESLAAHLEWRAGTARIDTRLRDVQIKPDKQWTLRLRAKLRRADADSRVSFAVIQSLELATAPVHAQLLAWLDRRVGRLEDIVGKPPEIQPLS